jgi:hypothetical protein
MRSYQRLLQAGFDSQTAFRLAMWHLEKDVKQQIEWLDRRKPTRNRLGMLRRAIEENWPEPPKATDENPDAALFARCFYAGHGGNDGEPVAEPSANDVAAADAYVSRLLSVEPEKTQVAQWGRRFGRYAAKQQRAAQNPIVSLVVAIRRCGDAFLARHRAEHQNSLTNARIAAQSAHQAAHMARWLDYVRECESRFRGEHADAYAEFERTREREREQMRTSPWQLRREEALSSFESEERRLRAFQQWFSDQVLNFWQWDEQRNRQAA